MAHKKKTPIIAVIAILAGLVVFVYGLVKIISDKKMFSNQAMLMGGAESSLLVKEKQAMPIALTIHEGHGHVVEGYKAEAAEEESRIIIHIQDIHTNYEAQKNMAQIIEYLIKEKDLKLIMVEGGWGDVSLSYLRTYANKERREEVAEEYLQEGKISGEEYLNIMSDYDMEIQGIEEEYLYKKNLDSFFKIEGFREEGTEKVEQLSDIANELKEKIYPAKLLELEKKHREYDEEEISLAEFYDYLKKISSSASLDPSALTNFTRFMEIAELEKEIDFGKVEKQRAGLIEKMSRLLGKEKLTPLVTKSLEFRLNKVSPAEYHSYLQETAKSANINIKDYPELSDYIKYIQSHEEINTNTLFKEADLLEKSATGLLLNTQEQKQLHEASKALTILNNFLNLKLIPEDFEYYKEHQNSFLASSWKPFLKERITKYNISMPFPLDLSVLDDNLATLVGFYDIANQRDETFIQKALSLMEEKDQKMAVLIAGGFHTPNLTEMFKKHGISYVVIAPKTTEKTDADQYRYILQYKSGRTE